MAKLVRISLVAGAAAIALTGCVGGTTYGTGVSQEEQTMKDVYNMFSLSRERKNIDYAPRPDLVVPADRASLPEPLDTESTASNTEWPETPEERIARIRAEAGEVDARSGDISVEERMRKKSGIRIEKGYTSANYTPGYTDKQGREVNPDLATVRAMSEEAQRLKAQQDMSKGANRKYLTEPPVAYRIPAETAGSGENAYTPEELAEMKKAEKAARIREKLGTPR